MTDTTTIDTATTDIATAADGNGGLTTARVDPALADELRDVLHDEAELLDEGRLREWTALLTDDITYQVPVRVQKERTDDGRVTGVMGTSFHMDENRTSIEMRVDRVETGFAWAEEPPSRLRHHITNVRVRPTDRDDELSVRSNVLVFRSRWDWAAQDLLSCERFDAWRRVDGRWRLARRLVLLDVTSVPTHNLSFFF
ncbi:MAG: 3-phenylpropionate/cinnamic acid dioxygenase subunit beta [Actinomycetota bacterium]|nr:3-phenylpropionate/cinnamic acid dioxygenase subunit beta [Actinomycetota bacterium]